MKKISVLIDGFNLYHAIKGLEKPHLKWVNVKALAACFVNAQDEQIQRVLFFTAPPHHTPQPVQIRYDAYTKALKHHGVEVIEGKFKEKFIELKHNGQSITKKTHEEKETDVNLALAVVEDAYERISDKLIVITNDSDISPAIRMAGIKNTDLKIKIVTPPLLIDSRTKKPRNPNFELLLAAGEKRTDKRTGKVYFPSTVIKEIHLERCLLPDAMQLEDGSTLTIPPQYRQP